MNFEKKPPSAGFFAFDAARGFVASVAVDDERSRPEVRTPPTPESRAGAFSSASRLTAEPSLIGGGAPGGGGGAVPFGPIAEMRSRPPSAAVSAALTSLGSSVTIRVNSVPLSLRTEMAADCLTGIESSSASAIAYAVIHARRREARGRCLLSARVNR